MWRWNGFTPKRFCLKGHAKCCSHEKHQDRSLSKLLSRQGMCFESFISISMILRSVLISRELCKLNFKKKINWCMLHCMTRAHICTLMQLETLSIFHTTLKVETQCHIACNITCNFKVGPCAHPRNVMGWTHNATLLHALLHTILHVMLHAMLHHVYLA